MADFPRNVPPGANNPMPHNPPAAPVTVDPRSRPTPQPVTPLPSPPQGELIAGVPLQPWSAPPAAPSPNVRPMR
jgi:hypothetical protein